MDLLDYLDLGEQLCGVMGLSSHLRLGCGNRDVVLPCVPVFCHCTTTPLVLFFTVLVLEGWGTGDETYSCVEHVNSTHISKAPRERHTQSWDWITKPLLAALAWRESNTEER